MAEGRPRECGHPSPVHVQKRLLTLLVTAALPPLLDPVHHGSALPGVSALALAPGRLLLAGLGRLAPTGDRKDRAAQHDEESHHADPDLLGDHSGHEERDTHQEASDRLVDPSPGVRTQPASSSAVANLGSSAYSARSICSSIRCSCSESGTESSSSSAAGAAGMRPFQDRQGFAPVKPALFANQPVRAATTAQLLRRRFPNIRSVMPDGVPRSYGDCAPIGGPVAYSICSCVADQPRCRRPSARPALPAARPRLRLRRASCPERAAGSRPSGTPAVPQPQSPA